MGTDLNIGHVTAYAYAKSKGYTGTEEQFATELAQFAQNAQKVAEDRAAVEQLVDEFLNTTAPAVIQDVTDEGTSQVERVANAGTAQVTRVGEAGNTQIDAVASAGTTQIGLVTDEGTTQVTRVQDKGDEVIDSIPADYTALTQEVSDLNRQISDLDSITSDGYINYVAVANGSFSVSTGPTTGSPNRIRTDLISFKKGDVITISNGTLRHSCGVWDGYVSSGTNVRNDNAWVLNNETITPDFDGFIVVVFSKSDNSNLTPADFDGSIKQYPSLMSKIIDYLPFFKTSEITFVNGYYYNTTNQRLQTDNDYSYVKLDVSLFRGGKINGVTSVTPNSSYGIAFVDSSDAFIIGYTSSNTGSYIFGYDLLVPDNASYIYISCRNVGKVSTWVNPNYPWDVVIDNIIKLASSIENTGNGFVNAKLLNSRHVYNGNNPPLTLLHFSDLHADKTALARIIDYAESYGSNVDNIICTGDMVSNTYEEIRDWWPDNILTCVGNHDTASYSQGSYNWTALSMADRDAYYIAPFESNWGITHITGTSYYYKDYITQKVRLIVMDGMLYNDNGAEASAQTAWLENLLADAITNNLHVVIAIHAPHGGATAEDCSFSRYGQGIMPTYNDCNTPQSVIDVVASKITSGLKFVGYIVGHTHQDNIWDAENNGTQLMYCVTCATTAQTSQWRNADLHRGIGFDAFNLVTIDTSNTLVKIVRGGGADIDDHMRTRKAICFNYSTGEIVGEVL